MQFEAEYKKLNKQQKLAVDNVEGPMMVVAGPGTGKTQLLSMRVGNILKKTDVNPSNILCLTFTESAAQEMQERLLKLIGQDAYSVAIHTFHNFGVEIINHYSEYFYHGLPQRPVDELGSYQILSDIFHQLAYSNPLSVQVEGKYPYLRPTQNMITNFKKSGLTPKQLRQVLDNNLEFLKSAQPLVAAAFDVPRFSQKQIPKVHIAYQKITALKITESVASVTSIKALLLNSLHQALESETTKEVIGWRSNWLRKDEHGKYTFKEIHSHKRLKAAVGVYQSYTKVLAESGLYDFDDMVLKVNQALKDHPNLLFDLQEKYQYFLIDEFQDTNDAQMNLINLLVSSPSSGEMPNLMVVADDDQAIYKFQGAELSNLLAFKQNYNKAITITLTDNYRSSSKILDTAAYIINQANTRLEVSYREINKSLTPHNRSETNVVRNSFINQASELYWVAQKVRELINGGVATNQIAILARQHKHLESIMPYLASAAVPVVYERRENVLDEPHIRQLIAMAKAVVALSNNDLDNYNVLLSEISSYEFWKIPNKELWQISSKAYRNRSFWHDELSKSSNKRARELINFLAEVAKDLTNESMEVALDQLIGTVSIGKYVSPYRSFYFSEGDFKSARSRYLELLSSLSTIRQRLRNYSTAQLLTLTDFVDYVQMHLDTDTHITNVFTHSQQEKSVQVMTAHKAKGLEFEHVFIINAQDEIWGSKSRSAPKLLKLPANLPLAPAGDNEDDKIRLFYVAVTRAKSHLYFTSHLEDTASKPSLPLKYLEAGENNYPKWLLPTSIDKSNVEELSQTLESDWTVRHISSVEDNYALLQPFLLRYKLSVTHLNNFVDISRNGPSIWLLHNLLRFPQALSSSAAFGSAMHKVLAFIQDYYNNNHKLPSKDTVLKYYYNALLHTHLSLSDYRNFSKRGEQAIAAILANHALFKKDAKPEYSFVAQGTRVGEIKITGNIDLITIDKQKGVMDSITVTDYKTGKVSNSWKPKTDNDKIKLHFYKRQLIFYKLLIDSSRQFGSNYTTGKSRLVFVEPSDKDTIVILDYQVTDDDVYQLKRLIKAVWESMMSLKLPDVSLYKKTYSGILQFEEDLINGK